MDEQRQMIKTKDWVEEKGKTVEKFIEKEVHTSSYRLHPIPAPDSGQVAWELQPKTQTIPLNAGNNLQAGFFVLEVKNLSDQALHHPHILTQNSADGVFEIIPTSPQPSYPQNEALYSRTSLIPPEKSVRLAARIIPTGERPITSKTYSLPVTVAVSGGASKTVTLKINLKTPDVQVANLDYSYLNNSVNIRLHNRGAADLPQAHFYLRDPQAPLNLPRQSLDGLTAQAEENFAFALPQDMPREQIQRLQLEIRPMRPPLYMQWYIPLNIKPLPVYVLVGLALGAVLLLLLAIFYFRRYRHPLLLQLSAQPAALLSLPLEQLDEAGKRLQQTGRLSAVLDSADVSQARLQQAQAFAQATSAEKAQILAQRLGVRTGSPLRTASPENIVYSLKLPADFLLNVDRLLLYFPDCDVKDAIADLKAIPQAEGRITLIIGADSAYQRALLNSTQDLSNKYVAPQNTQLSNLLLSPNAHQALAAVLAQQLSLKQISPYQIGGGVNKEAVFFGRRELLAQIINRDPANYLLVGGRQMGKSTLLKALERRYADNPQVQCSYHTLSNEVLVPRLAQALRLPKTEDAEVLAAALEQRIHDTGQRFIFLIDEADRFIAHEQVRGYPILNVFRRLSEQGQCSFMLAGFWQLYQHAVLDYQSPLRNFGEVLEVGALETDACTQLATRPMHSMRLDYANASLVDLLVERCGQRANLIAYACHLLIQSLPAKQRTIAAGDVQRVLDSRDMNKRVEGWLMGMSEQEQHYERLVAYATITQDSFSTGELLCWLEDKGLAFDAAELERSLSRLELAFVLKRENKRWFYPVPLFVQTMQEDDPELKLAALLRQWRG
ncbi:Uncharacterised protein [Candidatus Venteria ishoeyi]|uniref:ORC1/DEAH AAA+ ATPase domain-containing protein n=1 Tax=Candidatus Venteria ishoeyi TaxID=1899563 RepID=A0A1H6F7D2_9GAMM|nr:Uncharacterised protein [Candidatus Venteria ishoeyi]